MKSETLETLILTAELVGHRISDAAARLLASDLSRFPDEMIVQGLAKLRRSHKGPLTAPAIITAIEELDGHPSADEAWAQVSTDDEGRTLVLTEQSMLAMENARVLLADGDRVAARMAFKSAYEKIVQECRNRGQFPKWMISLGHDRNARAEVIAEAIAAGKIAIDHPHAALALDSPQKHLPAIAELANRLRITHETNSRRQEG